MFNATIGRRWSSLRKLNRLMSAPTSVQPEQRVLVFSFFSLKRPPQSDNSPTYLSRIDLWAAPFSSNLARKKWRLEGNGETVETTAEETKTAKFLMIQDFPIAMKDFS
jgi:hypothetical protein